jgi:hypothetical protein
MQFIESQKSLHLYTKLQKAIFNVLSSLTEEEFNNITNNLIIMALDDNASAQVMHFEPMQDRFKVMQVTMHADATNSDLEYVVAHEFGHVLQGRNWQEEDGLKLEEDAHSWAISHGFLDTRHKN